MSTCYVPGPVLITWHNLFKAQNTLMEQVLFHFMFTLQKETLKLTEGKQIACAHSDSKSKRWNPNLNKLPPGPSGTTLYRLMLYFRQ